VTRVRLPDTRPSVTRRFRVGDSTGHYTVGFYDDGRPGELFVCVDINTASREVCGLTDAWARQTSKLLQCGQGADAFESERNQAFGPEGPTGDPRVPFARSVVDYVSRVCLLVYWPEVTP
jgi:ribonucleoside-diphosphate reductase alpha chain